MKGDACAPSYVYGALNVGDNAAVEAMAISLSCAVLGGDPELVMVLPVLAPPDDASDAEISAVHVVPPVYSSIVTANPTEPDDPTGVTVIGPAVEFPRQTNCETLTCPPEVGPGAHVTAVADETHVLPTLSVTEVTSGEPPPI